jgi:hypothetical protein
MPGGQFGQEMSAPVTEDPDAGSVLDRAAVPPSNDRERASRATADRTRGEVTPVRSAAADPD